MLKLYKKEQDGSLSYAEYWINDNTAIIHFGKVGYRGKTEKTDNYLKCFPDELAFQTQFIKRFAPMGFQEIPEESCLWIVVQYPMKSLEGIKRDTWLKDRVTDVLNAELGWKGLGHVDGFDMGKTMSIKNQFALNILCIVVDEDKGISAIKSALREYYCDYTKVKIASRAFIEDSTYSLKYSAKKNDLDFYI